METTIQCITTVLLRTTMDVSSSPNIICRKPRGYPSLLSSILSAIDPGRWFNDPRSHLRVFQLVFLIKPIESHLESVYSFKCLDLLHGIHQSPQKRSPYSMILPQLDIDCHN